MSQKFKPRHLPSADRKRFPPTSKAGGILWSVGEKAMMVLESGAFAHHIKRFNAMEDEPITQLVPHAGAWEWLTKNISFWQHDVKDGMEESISGSRTPKNVRPTINSYRAANAAAIRQLGKRPEFVSKARRPDGTLSDAREAIGFIPWQFGLAEKKHSTKRRKLAT